MQIILLGTAAGGGFPQWNCWCPTCRVARTDPSRARPRTQSSIAVRAENGPWYLINASPDLRQQIADLPGDRTDSLRINPFAGIVLTARRNQSSWGSGAGPSADSQRPDEEARLGGR